MGDDFMKYLQKTETLFVIRKLDLAKFGLSYQWLNKKL